MGELVRTFGPPIPKIHNRPAILSSGHPVNILLKKLRLKVHRQEKRKVRVKIKIKQQKNLKMNLKKGERES